MQQLNTIIDTVTDAKTNALKTIVTEESFRKPLQEMVNAENALAKATVSYVNDMFAKCKMK
jgi:hypothetical protein